MQLPVFMVHNIGLSGKMGFRGKTDLSLISNEFFIIANLTLLQDILLRIKGIFSSKPVASINPYNDLKYLDNYIPQLFLYSNADKLILPGVSILFC